MRALGVWADTRESHSGNMLFIPTEVGTAKVLIGDCVVVKQDSYVVDHSCALAQYSSYDCFRLNICLFD